MNEYQIRFSANIIGLISLYKFKYLLNRADLNLVSTRMSLQPLSSILLPADSLTTPPFEVNCAIVGAMIVTSCPIFL